jgi:hypothetical protein
VKPRRAAGPWPALAVGVLLAACRHASSGAAGDPRAAARADSVEGIVRVVGVEALPVVTLVPGGASPSVTLDGPASLRRVSGLRVAVVGERRGSRLEVKRFTVLSANGVPATDGVLAADGDALVLVTADGARHRLVNPAPLLRASVGRRAWVSGALDREPVAYGIIE